MVSRLRGNDGPEGTASWGFGGLTGRQGAPGLSGALGPGCGRRDDGGRSAEKARFLGGPRNDNGIGVVWGLPGVGGVHLVFGEVGDVDGVVVGEEFELGAVGAGGVDALDDADF